MSVQVSYKKQTALFIIGISILLLVIEIIANVWWVTQINCEFEQNEIFQNFTEVEKRQLCLDLYNLKTSGDEIIPDQSTDSITINSLGFRGAEFLTIKPLDTYRIFMVGGSTMFGFGATSDETTIPAHLQQLLNEKDFGFDIEVINSGIQGADSNTELNLIQEKLVKFSPDLIVVYDGWNDLRANNPPMEVKANWERICEFSKENNFDVMITLQPIAGFGNKVLTKQELGYAQNGKDYNRNPLTESFSTYQDYAQNLEKIKTCAKTFDLRNIFDTETEPVYWDEAHVSDLGNKIVAESLYKTVFPIVSENYGLSVFETGEGIQKTSSLFYNDREIAVGIKLQPSNEFENKKIKITTYDNTNKKDVLNVTYFLSISKNNENLLREYFFAKDGVLILDIFPEDSNRVQVIGERQYDHNAYVMSEITPIEIKGPIFSTEGIYSFDTELRTIDSIDNWVFDLSGYYSEINIGNDNTFDEIFSEETTSFKTENLFRQIFSNYKTPVMLNEIFK